MMINVLRQAPAVFILLMLLIAPNALSDYSEHPEAKAFVDKMVAEHDFSQEELVALLSEAQKQQKILDAIARPAEKTKEWFEYRKIFIQESRIAQGVKFWQENSENLVRAAERFGVAPEIIVSIIGVETRYGRHKGGYRVLDALTTLGFDYPPRAKFFRGQLEQFLLMVREQDQDAKVLMGSYAGAMGYGQFIPSSFRAYAVDFDGDGKVDIWENTADAIGSVANYFREHRWQTDKPVVARVRIDENYDKSLLNSRGRPQHTLADLKAKGFVPVDQHSAQMKAMPLMFVGDNGKEFWVGFDNFYVITRYNRSHLYSMAVWELSQEIKARYDSQRSAMESSMATPANPDV